MSLYLTRNERIFRELYRAPSPHALGPGLHLAHFLLISLPFLLLIFLIGTISGGPLYFLFVVLPAIPYLCVCLAVSVRRCRDLTCSDRMLVTPCIPFVGWSLLAFKQKW